MSSLFQTFTLAMSSARLTRMEFQYIPSNYMNGYTIAIDGGWLAQQQNLPPSRMHGKSWPRRFFSAMLLNAIKT